MGYASFHENINDVRRGVDTLVDELQRLQNSEERQRAAVAGFGAHLSAIEGAARRALHRCKELIDEASGILEYITAPEQSLARDVLRLREECAGLRQERESLSSHIRDMEQEARTQSALLQSKDAHIRALKYELDALKQQFMSDADLDRLLKKATGRPR